MKDLKLVQAPDDIYEEGSCALCVLQQNGLKCIPGCAYPHVEGHWYWVENVDTVTISKKEYESLKEDSKWLSCLESAGVDNWSGYDFARELMEEDDE